MKRQSSIYWIRRYGLRSSGRNTIHIMSIMGSINLAQGHGAAASSNSGSSLASWLSHHSLGRRHCKCTRQGGEGNWVPILSHKDQSELCMQSFTWHLREITSAHMEMGWWLVGWDSEKGGEGTRDQQGKRTGQTPAVVKVRHCECAEFWVLLAQRNLCWQ